VSPIIVGHSMAAYLATVYATRHPVTATVNVDQPLRLTDLAPLVRQIVDGDQQTFDHAAERLIASMRLETMPGFHDAVRPRPNRTVFLGYCQELGARTPAELDSWLTNTAAAVTGPYLSILSREPWPGYDGWLRDLLPTSTCHVYQQEGHFPHLSDPTRFVQDLYALSGRSG
jgi:pimeloyl-ACP methyl ester carboxylesterase